MKSLLQELRDNEYTLISGKFSDNRQMETYQTESGRVFYLIFEGKDDKKAKRTAKIKDRGQFKTLSNFYRWRIEGAMRKGAERE